MKIFNSIFIILFVLFAVLQYNDPDPYVWIPIYLFAAYLCWCSYRKNYKPQLFQIALVVFILYDLYLFFDKTGVLNWAVQHQSESIVQTMKATKPWIEETREFFGLLIVIIVLIINMIYLRKLKTKPVL
ncbi:MAG: transmembrane 220 family protein [Bacteroidota bacterium]